MLFIIRRPQLEPRAPARSLTQLHSFPLLHRILFAPHPSPAKPAADPAVRLGQLIYQKASLGGMDAADFHSRKTRSGAEFSPYPGPAKVAHCCQDFSLQEALPAAIFIDDSHAVASEEGEAESLLASDGVEGLSDLPSNGLCSDSRPSSPAASTPAAPSWPKRARSTSPEPLPMPELPTSRNLSNLPDAAARSDAVASRKPGETSSRAHKRTRRAKFRQKLQTDADAPHRVPAPSAIRKYGNPPAFSSTAAASDFPLANGGFIGRRQLPPAADSYAGRILSLYLLLQELKFQLIPWDGETNCVIVDREGRIIVNLAGKPKGDASWSRVVHDAGQAMDDVLTNKETNFQLEDPPRKHTRGEYSILRAGFTFGGGPTEPHNVANRAAKKAEACRRLTRNAAFSRLAGFASSAFQTAGPRLFRSYWDVLGDVQSHTPGLQRAFANSVFPTAVFNFGPQAITFPHKDYQNVPYGWCAIAALGDYDPKKGGHLFLWELGLVIEFPPGSTILIPSALITHGNTPIQDGECRKSFTQYCAGALMRWHAYGFRTEAALPLGAKKAFDKAAPARAEEALALFSKWSELAEDLAKLSE
ncbi:hypothetical protein BV25DRAFT_1911639 [Artomyces pyxidatus]|uniref:Uncharacterized protein n=1 Tax=Artomyces pyxidatus TaxID=48021 RepID=A0ACB8TH27_9AGAM|nr:hypothetical protein BV25DRAFT_1911639 [Artomyces pyxidatus]